MTFNNNASMPADIPAIFYKLKMSTDKKRGIFKNMRILAFNWRDPKNPLAGGAEEYLFNILSLIANDKNKVTYFVASFPGSRSREEGENYTIIRKGSRFTVYVHAALFYIKNRKKYDVVIDSINTVPFFIPLYVGKNKRIAIIYHFGGWKTIRKELPLFPSIVAYIAEKSIALFYKNTDIITVSNSTKEDLLKKNIDEKRIKIVWSGVKTVKNRAYNEIKKASVPTVVYIGRIKFSKNIDHVIKAFKIVKSRIKNAELIIGGKGDEDCYTYLKNLKKEENIDNVHFLGELNEKDKTRYLELAWVFVYPSAKEGWGISAIEANTCGTPVIAYNVPGLRDSIKDTITGMLAKENDIGDLADKITFLLNNQIARDELGKNAIGWSKNFSYEKSAEKFYEELKFLPTDH